MIFQIGIQTSNFRAVIEFFGRIGLYDVVLPFILVFTIVFAIFEKTRVLGHEEHDGHRYPKKNLNSMAAFVIAFLVVASTRLVAIINQTASQVTILLMAIVLFLLLVGAFLKEGETSGLEGGWRSTFMIFSFIGIILIFLNAVGWLDDLWGAVSIGGNGTEAAGAVALLIIVIAFMVYTVRDLDNPTGSQTGSSGGDQGGHH